MTAVREAHHPRHAWSHPASHVLDFVNGNDGVKCPSQKERRAPNRGSTVPVVVLQVFVTKEVFGHARVWRHDACSEFGTMR